LNVGVGADFPVDSAEPRRSDEERSDGCDYGHFRHHHRGRFGRRHGWRGGRFFYFGPLVLVVFIALISLAVSYPMVILGLVAIAALAFAARRHHHWHDHFDGDDGRDGDDRRERDDWGRRDDDQRYRRDAGPQPDAPDGAAPGRN